MTETGRVTGRTASSGPNIQQLPRQRSDTAVTLLKVMSKATAEERVIILDILKETIPSNDQ